ncbi:hypothetical protein [Actinoplanes sp. NBRC 103695]|uniref:hypothetical protein n=1 Tax=Actinoplanes sp. NBRC 103695 TaxID=3032202 RepID=UPI0025576CE0|nr:hypothetical protein [Actinoplanes sp. NBRC 103695]
MNPRTARLTAESALLGLIAGVIVVAPWTRDGYLLLLDWVSGPHQTISPGLYGLDPAALDALPYRLATHVLRGVVGAAATAWLVLLAFFPIAASGISALAGGGRVRRHCAALFVCCNPFVVERIQAGHVAFLLSVALLSWLLASAVRARRRGRWFAARPAGWYALAMAVGPHAAWIGGAILLAVALLPRPRRADLVRTAVTVASAGLIYAYAAAVLLGAVLVPRVGGQDLEVYAPHAGSGGLPVTLLSLQGFWRATADSSPPIVLGPIPVGAMIAAVVAGLVLLCRRDRVAGVPLVLLAVTGLLLGAGIHGPLGGAYRAAFDSVPLFAVMREQQKWIALPLLAYAVAVGVTAEALATVARGAKPRPAASGPAASGPAAALPAMIRAVAAAGLVAVAGVGAAVAPSLAWGLGNSVQVSQYPASWYAADDLMGAGTEGVLFLPWHQYQPFGFTGSRTVATPAGAFFRRPVLTSDAVELGPVRTNSVSRRTAYVQRLVAAGGAGHFGRLVAPLGIRYVVLARDREADGYTWLGRQPDLRRVMRTPNLDVYRVQPTGTGRVVSARVAGHDEAVALAARGELGTEALLPDDMAGADGQAAGVVPSAAAGRIQRISSTRWRVAPGSPGWVVLPEEWSAGWTAGEAPTRPTVAGTVAVRAGPGEVTVTYEPWRRLRIGLGVSLLALALLIAAGLVEHRRDLRTWWTDDGGSSARYPGPG